MSKKTLVGIGVVVAALSFGIRIGSHAADNHRLKESTVAAGQAVQWSFDREKAGSVPAGARTLSGSWSVRAEKDAPTQPQALCQTASARFPAIILSDRIFADVTVSARFKAISGSEDRAAGIIFRIQDENNFYILRANALEDNVNIYGYVAGSRQAIKEGSAKVPAGQWQELRVEVTGNDIRGYLNGKLVVEAKDDTFQAGKIGLWTKADSVTCFDDVEAIAQ
ncbi:family 16 glycoside hydrolase [Geomonas sp.]|uniref:family 16 glycoside hydrolase n=1 Tax=Geomonas sp. TaxID=2651584 RepID=UPI002B46ED37|nr:family 16 glycoside hydrolase [Geomonas sp.]HJV36242.1 family 16 glycoside hydrolase [Geomonas sp.]